MKAGMVAADTDCGPLAAWPTVCALIVDIGAALVPELVASTLAYSCVAVVAGSVGKGASRPW